MNRKAVIIIIAVLIMVGLGAGVWFFMFKPEEQQPATSAAGPGNTPAGFPAGAPQFQTIASSNSLPDKATLLRAAQISGWDSAYVNAIVNSYNQANGQARHGDWLMQVINNNPITIRFTKGKEMFTLISRI